jgi:hypothetical protein
MRRICPRAVERQSQPGGANQIDNRQLEIGNDFTLPPLRSNQLLGITVSNWL